MYGGDDMTLIDKMSLNYSIQLQEIFQVLGFLIAVVVVATNMNSINPSSYAAFVVPLCYFAVARADYLIHRNGAKLKAIDKSNDHIGNEAMQSAGGSLIALFDIPVFLLLAIGAKAVSPQGLSDASVLAICYWISCAVAAIMVWLATKLGGRNYESYLEVLKDK